MGSYDLFIDIVREELRIRAETKWRNESIRTPAHNIDTEMLNHSRTWAPPTFKMLPAVYSWRRIDEWDVEV